ncbi:MAG: hypothetical protein D6679_02350 [Candidatus Hydrogenedentota bacterium]|nr:MAG: hypothetical protein D6679_02350 [Candidatus Hydrogenedentota bacterium]
MGLTKRGEEGVNRRNKAEDKRKKGARKGGIQSFSPFFFSFPLLPFTIVFAGFQRAGTISVSLEIIR